MATVCTWCGRGMQSAHGVGVACSLRMVWAWHAVCAWCGRGMQSAHGVGVACSLRMVWAWHAVCAWCGRGMQSARGVGVACSLRMVWAWQQSAHGVACSLHTVGAWHKQPVCGEAYFGQVFHLLTEGGQLCKDEEVMVISEGTGPAVHTCLLHVSLSAESWLMWWSIDSVFSLSRASAFSCT